MISPRLFDVVQCPDCASAIEPAGHAARCRGCGRPFEAAHGFLDLRPAAAFAEQTKYTDEALHDNNSFGMFGGYLGAGSASLMDP